MTNLVIVESPAKCQKIQGFLGPGWRVIASMGHIRALEENLDAIGLDRDFEPKYQF
jgi:DNA topoisomerase-1